MAVAVTWTAVSSHSSPIESGQARLLPLVFTLVAGVRQVMTYETLLQVGNARDMHAE